MLLILAWYLSLSLFLSERITVQLRTAYTLHEVDDNVRINYGKDARQRMAKAKGHIARIAHRTHITSTAHTAFAQQMHM